MTGRALAVARWLRWMGTHPATPGPARQPPAAGPQGRPSKRAPDAVAAL